jgi:hypothetical protein
MISDPYKIEYIDAKKNFSFRPMGEEKKGNIKLKPFVTDKARIEKYLKSHHEEHEKYNKNKISIECEDNNLNINNRNGQRSISEKPLIKNNSKTNSTTNMEKYLQPIMKFKPRTDLERIFDAINLNYYGKIDRNLINEQLKSLGLVTVYNKKNPKLQTEYSLLKEKLKVNPETLNYLIKEKQRLEQGPKTNEINELISNMENIIHINKEIISEEAQKNFSSSSQKARNIRNKRRNLNNFLAKNILSEYQKKTHFKALCTCSLDLNDSYKKKNFKLGNSRDIKNEDKYNSFNTLYNRKINFDYNNNTTGFKYNSINLYKKQFHTKKKYPEQELDYLKNLFSQQHIDGKNPFGNIHDNQRKINDEENDSYNKIYRQANLVLINGKFFNKNDMKGISNAVLKECNYIKKYFDSENAGEGKTMITRGMTVNEFTRKYKLPK